MAGRRFVGAAAAVVVAALVGVGGAGLVTPAQPEHSIRSGLAETPVARMVGEWRGTSWAITPSGERRDGRVVERVRWNLAGTALLVEGYGYSVDDASGEITVTHDAIGVIEQDARTGTISMTARRAGAAFETHAMTIDPESGVLQWSPKTPQGVTVRFRVTLDEKSWTEVGEMSRDDGQTWTQFLGMELRRAPSGSR